jgi:Uma2 family endonuclease
LTERHGPWTVDELHRLPDDEYNRYEIDDGVLIVSPRPSSPHQFASYRITDVLNRAIETAQADLVAVPEVEVFTARRDDWLKVSDIAVVTWDAFDCEPQEYEAADVALVVEISGTVQSARRDFGEKLSAYAEAGVQHYWVLELTPAPRLTVFELVGTEYKQIVSSRGPIELTRPFPVEIDPGRLTRPRRD